MKKTNKLFNECLKRDLHISLTWQRITNWSVEIYIGYRMNYRQIFYIQNVVSKKDAVKKALKFLKTYKQ